MLPVLPLRKYISFKKSYKKVWVCTRYLYTTSKIFRSNSKGEDWETKENLAWKPFLVLDGARWATDLTCSICKSQTPLVILCASRGSLTSARKVRCSFEGVYLCLSCMQWSVEDESRPLSSPSLPRWNNKLYMMLDLSLYFFSQYTFRILVFTYLVNAHISRKF